MNDSTESGSSAADSPCSQVSELTNYRTRHSIAESIDDFIFGGSEPLSPYDFLADLNYDPGGYSAKLSPALCKAPRPVHDDFIPFFMSYHRESINYGRYFWYWDHYRFIKERLLDLAARSDLLQYAIVAFSAGIYSIQIDRRMRRHTFLFYAKAIRELQQAIDVANSRTLKRSLPTIIAAILELASVEASPLPPMHVQED